MCTELLSCSHWLSSVHCNIVQHVSLARPWLEAEEACSKRMRIDLTDLLLVFNAAQNKAHLVLLGEAPIVLCSTIAMALNCTGWIPMVWVPQECVVHQ